MVNASLNWASIVGIVLAVSGAGLYFLRSFKPALARDYDVFFAAIGLLCGGILFFQGWRLDPILQFGQFLLAGTTVFFAYESVRLRGVATDQARRSSYFDDEQVSPAVPGEAFRESWNEASYDQFEEASQPVRRRFSGRLDKYSDESEEDIYRSRRTSRAAIPEQAASRNVRRQNDQRNWNDDSESARRMARFGNQDEERAKESSFGQRRSMRQEQRRGSRPSTSQGNLERRRFKDDSSNASLRNDYSTSNNRRRRAGSSLNRDYRSTKAEDAAFTSSRGRDRSSTNSSYSSRNDKRSVRERSSQVPKENQPARRSSYSSNSTSRDNSSRFDD